MLNHFPLSRPLLEINSQRDLPRAVAGVLCRLRRAEYAKGWITNLCRRRSEVRVIKHIRKRRLETHPQPLLHLKNFRHTQARRARAGAFQNSHSGVAKASHTNRRGRESSRVGATARATSALVQICQDT